jgi:hypothetical protein
VPGRASLSGEGRATRPTEDRQDKHMIPHPDRTGPSFAGQYLQIQADEFQQRLRRQYARPAARIRIARLRAAVRARHQHAKPAPAH